MKIELNKTIVSIATAAFLALASWALYSITELKTESQMCKYTDNIYNGLFQELFEKHSEDRSALLRGMTRRLATKPTSIDDITTAGTSGDESIVSASDEDVFSSSTDTNITYGEGGDK